VVQGPLNYFAGGVTRFACKGITPELESIHFIERKRVCGLHVSRWVKIMYYITYNSEGFCCVFVL
jgi:hypothetical protein